MSKVGFDKTKRLLEKLEPRRYESRDSMISMMDRFPKESCQRLVFLPRTKRIYNCYKFSHSKTKPHSSIRQIRALFHMRTSIFRIHLKVDKKFKIKVIFNLRFTIVWIGLLGIKSQILSEFGHGGMFGS